MKIQLPSANRKFLSKDDIGAREIPVEIAAVSEVEFASGDKKTAIAFAGKQKRLVANLPVLRTLCAAWSDDSDKWIGRRAVMYVDPEVSFGGTPVGALRLRPLAGAAPVKPAATSPVHLVTPAASTAIGDDSIPF